MKGEKVPICELFTDIKTEDFVMTLSGRNVSRMVRPLQLSPALSSWDVIGSKQRAMKILNKDNKTDQNKI